MTVVVRTEPLPPTIEGRSVDDELGNAEVDIPLSGLNVDVPLSGWEVNAPFLAWEVVVVALFGWEVDSGLGVDGVDGVDGVGVELPSLEEGVLYSACTRK